MATPEALVKYYECLKNSFNKIQDKNNETALVNAALRPKICDEFAKSREVLNSYLDYIQVFSDIYSDKFKNVCSEIIVPLFKTDVIAIDDTRQHNNNNDDTDNTTGSKDESSQKALKLHETIRTIIEEKSNLTNDFVICVTKAFPTISGKEGPSNESFSLYLRNCLEVCKHLHGEPLSTLVTKILEKITPSCFLDDTEETPRIITVSRESYDIVCDFLDRLERSDSIKITRAIVNCFTQEFISPPWNEQLNYLILYICSSSPEMVDESLDLLRAVFVDVNRPIGERVASMIFSSSLLARSKFVELDKVLSHIECTISWCDAFLEELMNKKPTPTIADGGSEDVDAFRAAATSIFYLITQRYREMYEKDTIDRLVKLDLDKIIDNPYKPLEFADRELRQRFNEVAALYHIAEPYETKLNPNKRRRSDHISCSRLNLAAPFEENPKSLPDRIRPLFRNYYHHRNFTVVRE